MAAVPVVEFCLIKSLEAVELYKSGLIGRQEMRARFIYYVCCILPDVPELLPSSPLHGLISSRSETGFSERSE